VALRLRLSLDLPLSSFKQINIIYFLHNSPNIGKILQNTFLFSIYLRNGEYARFSESLAFFDLTYDFEAMGLQPIVKEQ